MSSARSLRAPLPVWPALAAVLLGASPAAALIVDLAAYSSHSINPGSEELQQKTEDKDVDTTQVLDETHKAETLVTADGIRFFTRTTGPDEPVFVSALARADGHYGVGASGITGLESADVAEASNRYTVTNEDVVSKPFTQELKVEPIEALTWVIEGFSGTQEFGAMVSARLTQTYVHILADETRLNEQQVFNLAVHVEKDATGSFYRDISPDLQEVLDRMDENGDPEVAYELVQELVDGQTIFGFRSEAFDYQVQIATLAPGESAEVIVVAQAVIYRPPELGGQAFIGDPFTIDFPEPEGDAAFGLYLGGEPVVPLPEPSRVLLALTGLAVLLVRGFRTGRSAGATATSQPTRSAALGRQLEPC